MRIEKDYIGEIELEDDVYYGISTHRAISNFDISTHTVNYRIIKELVNVKKQAAITNKKLKYLKPDIADAIISACNDIMMDKYRNQFPVNKYQGGAGTSTNMNVNEVISNVALEYLGHEKGRYDIIHPINHVNLHQSTNDTFPTAIKIACIKEIRYVADQYAELQKTLQEKETEFGSVLKLARTQYMDAVPMLAGQMFGA